MKYKKSSIDMLLTGSETADIQLPMYVHVLICMSWKKFVCDDIILTYWQGLLKLSKKNWKVAKWLPRGFVCTTVAKVQGLLFCGGYYPSTCKRHMIFKTDRNCELEIVPMPPSQKECYDFTLASCGNYLYCIGGEYNKGGSSGKYSKEVHRFDPNSAEWITLPNMNQARKLPGAIGIGDYLVVAGGLGCKYKPVSTIEILDLSQSINSQVWIEVGPLPERIVHPQLVVVNDQLIVGANRDLSHIPQFPVILSKRDQEVFSLPLEELHCKASKSNSISMQEISLEWSRFPLLPNGGSALVEFNSQLLAVGGRNPKSMWNCKKCYMFDESTQEWVLSGEIRAQPCVSLFAFYDPDEDILEVVGVLNNVIQRFGVTIIISLLLILSFNIIYYSLNNPRLHSNQLLKFKLIEYVIVNLILTSLLILLLSIFHLICHEIGLSPEWRSIDMYQFCMKIKVT